MACCQNQTKPFPRPPAKSRPFLWLSVTIQQIQYLFTCIMFCWSHGEMHVVVGVTPFIHKSCNNYVVVQIQMIYSINCSVVYVTMTSLLLCDLDIHAESLSLHWRQSFLCRNLHHRPPQTGRFRRIYKKNNQRGKAEVNREVCQSNQLSLSVYKLY